MLIHALYFNCRLPNSHVLFNYFQEHKTEIKITVFCDKMRCNLVELMDVTNALIILLLTNNVIDGLALLIRIWETLGSNLGAEAG